MEIVVIAPFADKEAGGRSRHVGDVLELADARAEELAGLGYVAPAAEEAAEEAADEAAEEAAPEEPGSKSTRAELAAYAAALGVEFAADATKAEIRAAIEAR